MVKHREHIPLLLALSLGIGLIPDMFHALSYSRSISLLPVLPLGIIVGSLLCYGAITWIQRHQSNGVVHLGIGASLVILAYLLVVYVISWANWAMNSSMLCAMLLAADHIDCGYKGFVLQSMADFALMAGVYIWGIRFEGISKHRLIYKFSFRERTKGSASIA